MKYALLDTDFISKTHTVKVDDNNHLIDRVLEMPEYVFVCHEQTLTELRRHNSHAPTWLKQKIDDGVIQGYSDTRILMEMSSIYGQLAPVQYTNMVRISCDAFDADYFAKHYVALRRLNYRRITVGDYLSTLSELDARIGAGNNIGEIKSYVLLQWLANKHVEQLFYFCSDDKGARNGILGIDGIDIRCISLVSAYQRLHLECGFTVETAKPYIDAILGYYAEHGQDNIQVIEASKIGRHLRVPCEQVLGEIFEDKFVELKNGFLKYRA